MAWDLDTAKKYLGIAPGDETKDAQIQGVMDYVLRAIETMLKRGLLQQQDVERRYHTTGKKVLLHRYPIVSIDQVDGSDTFDAPLINADTGWIEDAYFADKEQLEITYTGGWDPLPADLERVMWEAFMLVWRNTDADTGGPPPQGGQIIQGSGDVKSLTVFDAFKIDYDVGSTAAQDTAVSLASQQADWGWLAPWAAILQLYRSDAGVGMGIA